MTCSSRSHRPTHSLMTPLGLLILLVLLVGCGGAGTEDLAEEAGVEAKSSPPVQVTFTEPVNGAKVASPVHVVMRAENLLIEPAGEVQENAGHFHIIIDAECTPVGQTIPNDETHLHYGQGESEADLALTPGEHALCLQVADGAHIALEGEGTTSTIKVTVP